MTNQNCDIEKNHTAQSIAGFVILFVLFGSGCSTIRPKLQDEYRRSGLSDGMSKILDEYRQTIIAKMTKNKIPGLSVALVDRDGIIWTAGFGYTDYNRKTPVTPETIFAIMSMTKTITATAVMIAVRDGLVDLDVPIINYYPEFMVNSRFEENPQKKITLRHLLNHTSGIAHEAPVGNGREPSCLSLEDHVESISSTWLKHKVGEGYNYSGLGYDLAAYILELRSGKPYAKYLEEKIFNPLKMYNSSVDVKQICMAGDIPWDGCGGVYANAKEMAQFIQMFLNDGKFPGQEFIDENVIKAMATPTVYNSTDGMGFIIYNDPHGFYRLGHPGQGLGFTSSMEWIPEYGVGFVFLANSDVPLPFGGDNSDILLELVNKQLVQKTKSFEIPSVETINDNQPLDPNNFTPFKAEWKKYIGTYKYVMSGYKFDIPAGIALALGITTEYTHVKIYKKEGYLYIDSMIIQNDNDGGRLDEYLPGLFFTPSGKCLDLRGPKLTWENYTIKKVR